MRVRTASTVRTARRRAESVACANSVFGDLKKAKRGSASISLFVLFELPLPEEIFAGALQTSPPSLDQDKLFRKILHLGKRRSPANDGVCASYRP